MNAIAIALEGSRRPVRDGFHVHVNKQTKARDEDGNELFVFVVRVCVGRRAGWIFVNAKISKGRTSKNTSSKKAERNRHVSTVNRKDTKM